jgi:hypothetical protein
MGNFAQEDDDEKDDPEPRYDHVQGEGLGVATDEGEEALAAAPVGKEALR